METVSRSGLLLWDRTALKSVRSSPASLSTKLNGYQADDLQDETLWLLFRADFRDWNTDSFNNCSQNTVYKFRDMLRQRGVWVEKLDTLSAAQSLNSIFHELVQIEWFE
jgi:hypothetical protein